jgi:hypothetical protein
MSLSFYFSIASRMSLEVISAIEENISLLIVKVRKLGLKPKFDSSNLKPTPMKPL